jgi:hypothetical protein
VSYHEGEQTYDNDEKGPTQEERPIELCGAQRERSFRFRYQSQDEEGGGHDCRNYKPELERVCYGVCYTQFFLCQIEFAAASRASQDD